MTVRTCTKVNIGLHVMRKRPDGYHDLETLFVPYYGYGDVLTVEPSERLSIEITRDEGVNWDPQQDLTMKAWRLLKADFPQLPAVSIRLRKHAPVGAGLGGGSADAAFMLRAMDALGGLGLSDATLAAYAAKLGSDCAFFIYNRPMFATGRGEILEPFDIDLSGYELRVEIPVDAATGLPVAVSTREAYGGILPRDVQVLRCAQNDKKGAQNDIKTPLRELLREPIGAWKDIIVNDFEATVFPAHPQIEALKRRFYEDGAIYAAMSGSGSAVFGLFPKID